MKLAMRILVWPNHCCVSWMAWNELENLTNVCCALDGPSSYDEHIRRGPAPSTPWSPHGCLVGRYKINVTFVEYVYTSVYWGVGGAKQYLSCGTVCVSQRE